MAGTRIGLCTLEFHLGSSRSLKDKRAFLRKLRDRLSGRHNVAVAEVEFQDLWQRSRVAVVSVSNSSAALDRTFQRVIRDVERSTHGELIGVETEIL